MLGWRVAAVITSAECGADLSDRDGLSIARHLYFAYGSNLCVQQMARALPRCRRTRGRAMLADHDWLINERGVATIEPFAGSEVHGVSVEVTDHDLAALDSAEGVPVRYRRDRMTVHTADGPAGGLGVHRPPRRTGAAAARLSGAHHRRRAASRLPQRWVEFLRRWDPANWPRPLDVERDPWAAVTFRATRRSLGDGVQSYCGPGSGSWRSTAAAWSR